MILLDRIPELVAEKFLSVAESSYKEGKDGQNAAEAYVATLNEKTKSFVLAAPGSGMLKYYKELANRRVFNLLYNIVTDENSSNKKFKRYNINFFRQNHGVHMS